MLRYPTFYFFCLLLFATPLACAESVRLQIKGLSGKLEENVQARLSTINTDDVVVDGRFRARVDEAVRQGLRALGYYEPTLDFDFQKKTVLASSLFIVKVVPGKPVYITGVDIVLQGGAKNDRDYQVLVREARPKIGSILDHGEFDNFKNSLSSLALRKGYFDAEMIKSQLGVAPELHKAFWNVDFDSGQRYRFGKVLFQGSQISEDYLQSLVTFREGQDYSSDDLAELNSRLANTNWFNSVVVSPDFRDAKKSKTLLMDAVVTPRSKNMVEFGGGYFSDVGPRVKASWKKPWINSHGHSLITTADVSAPEQSLDTSYKIPLLKNPLEQYYLLQGGFKRSELNDTKSDTTTLNVARFWNFSSGWQRSTNLRWRLDHYTQASVTDTTMLLYLGVGIKRTRQRGDMMPTWGDSQQYSVDISDTSWGSNVDFLMIQAQNVWIRTLAEKNRFVIRGNVGWIDTNNFDRVPPSLRFFAGGDRSIRGYKYKNISPRDSKNELTGASKMLTGSLEYQYNVTGKWWGAVFADSGEAVNNIHKSDFKTGVGVGVRWASPIGPVRFDIAAPVNNIQAKGLEFYIGLGPEL